MIRPQEPVFAHPFAAFFRCAERVFHVAGSLASHQTTDADHGRIEVRRAFVSRDVGWLAADRRFPGEWRFPGLAMIGTVDWHLLLLFACLFGVTAAYVIP